MSIQRLNFFCAKGCRARHSDFHEKKFDVSVAVHHSLHDLYRLLKPYNWSVCMHQLANTADNVRQRPFSPLANWTRFGATEHRPKSPAQLAPPAYLNKNTISGLSFSRPSKRGACCSIGVPFSSAASLRGTITQDGRGKVFNFSSSLPATNSGCSS